MVGDDNETCRKAMFLRNAGRQWSSRRNLPPVFEGPLFGLDLDVDPASVLEPAVFSMPPVSDGLLPPAEVV